MLITIQATASNLRSQITTLQAALEGAREEIAARKEHEAILTSRFRCVSVLSELEVCHILMCKYLYIDTELKSGQVM